MKIFLISLFITIISNFGLSQSSSAGFTDTVLIFPGDISYRISQNNERRIVELWKSDTSKIIKYYQSNSNLLYWAYEVNQYNQRNGSFYSLDTLNDNRTYSYFRYDTIIYSYTLSSNNDTVSSIKLLNDSTLYNVLKSEDGVCAWISNVHLSRNGYYTISDIKSGLIKEYREYRTINRSNILDYKIFEEKYKAFVGQPIFSSGSIVIPFGTWTYYDTKGKVVKTVVYDWVGIIS
jgi:hypothetical protein